MGSAYLISTTDTNAQRGIFERLVLNSDHKQKQAEKTKVRQ